MTTSARQKVGGPRPPGALPAMFLLICALTGIPAVFASAAAAETAPPPGLQLLQVGDQIFLGVLPRKKGNYDELSRFEVVIDLRFPYEGVYDEQGTLRGMGIHYVNIPTSSNSPDPKSVLAVEKELAAAGTKSVLIHDSDGYRSAMVWAAHRMNTGTTLDAALLQVAPLTGSKELRPKLERYVKQLPVNPQQPR